MRRFTVYDSRTRETRLFAPISPPRVGLYVCGLTPYAPAHVGHGRTMTFFDVVARALRRWGYRVFYVQNVTNLDDHLIARAAEEEVDPLALAERHFHEFQRSMDVLGSRSVNHYPFATDYVPEILTQIRQLVEKGYAYATDDGSVYFSVGQFPEYGKLSGQKLEALKPGARLELDARKRAPEDFVIWKATTPGEPSWESPWGPGRPGWHIEDTAMIFRLARGAVRPPRRGGRPHLPAPRGRGRPRRSGERESAVRELLDARRAPAHGGGEDVQVARERRVA